MENLFGLLITIIVFGLVFWLIYWLVGQLPLPEPFKTVAVVIVGLIGVMLLLGLLFGWTPMPHFVHWR